MSFQINPVKKRSFLELSIRLVNTHSTKIIIILVLGLCMLYSYLLPNVIHRSYGRLLVLIPFGVLGTVAAIKSPSLGLVTIIIADLVVPFAVGTGSQTSLGAPILLLALCTGLWILHGVVNKRTIKLDQYSVLVPLIIFLSVVTFSLMFGQLTWFIGVDHAPIRAQLGGLGLFYLSAFAFLLVSYQTRDEKWLRWLVWTFLGVSAVFIFGRLVPQIGRYTNGFMVYGVTMSLFWVWLVSLSLSQALVNRKLPLFWRIALAALGLATLYVGLQDNSWTSGWLPACIAAAGILLLGIPRLGLFLATLGLGSLVLMNNRVSSLVMQGDNEYSLMTRLEAWQILLRMLRTSPIFGFGPANYYWYTPLFPIRGYSVVFNSHNNYIDLLAQVGVIGLGCFLWFFAALARMGWGLRSRVPDGFQKAYVIGALGGLAGTLAAGMLGDWVIPFVYNIGYTGFRASLLGWMFLGGLMSLDLMNPKAGGTQVA